MKCSHHTLWRSFPERKGPFELEHGTLMHRLDCWQLIYRPDTGEILGVHILGLHAADLIHEASNAIAMGNTIKVSTICQ